MNQNNHFLYFFLFFFLISHALFSRVYLFISSWPFFWQSLLYIVDYYFLWIFFSIYIPLFILFSLFCLILFCCRALSGCSAKSNSPSYNSTHAISNNGGRAASSFFSAWICGEDRHFSEVSWSASSSSLSFFLCLSLYYICLTAGWVNVVLWKRAMLINLIICIRMAPINCFLDKKCL